MHRLGFAVALGLACVIVATMAMVAAIGFGCLSLYFYLVTVTTPSLAAFGVALTALLFAVILIALIGLIPRPRLRSVLPPEYDVLSRFAAAMQTGKTLGAEGRQYAKANLSGVSLAAFGFGIAMGISPRLRKLVLDILKP